MRWMTAIAGFAMVMAASPALAADQFDLVCKGKGIEKRYRVDLTRNEWCAEACGRVMKIASVTSGTLLLQNEGVSQGGDIIVEQISRSNGDWLYRRELPSLHFGKLVRGSCEPATFSGFPAAKF